MPPQRFVLTLLLTGAAIVAAPGLVPGASKRTIAALGDAAPGGGVFAGPAFTSPPSAAGTGWIAFRSQVTGGASTETMVVAHMLPPISRATVASLGQSMPSAGPFAGCAGTLKSFLGPPTVNAHGDVAFMALVEPPPSASANAAAGPAPAGIFVFRGGQLAPIACSAQRTANGIFDLTAVLDLNADPSQDFAERAPSMNDAGDVAFLTGYVDANGFPTGGAVILAPRAGGFTEIAHIGGLLDPLTTFQTFGPPALNNHDAIAFHAFATTKDPNDDDGIFDGVLRYDGTVHVVARDGLVTPAVDQFQVVSEFEDPVALNDRGDVAFLAGPLLDVSNAASINDLGNPGIFVWRAGTVTTVAFPGEALGADPNAPGAVGGPLRITGVTLGLLGGLAFAGPSLAPDGTLAAFVSLNAGSAEAIARWDGRSLQPIAFTGGPGADKTPTGGVYAGTESGPAIDASGGIVFLARIAGGSTSEAIIYRAADGTKIPIGLGEAAPQQSQGYFGGKPFTAAHLNDRGDVVFRAFVTRGTSSAGIFRFSAGTLGAVVRTGDPAPVQTTPPFLDLVGEPSVNGAGAIAFAAAIDKGRGIFVADDRGVHAVAVRGDDAPGDKGTVFAALSANPEINDQGAVAFRGTAVRRDPITGFSTKYDGIFVRDAGGMHALARTDPNSVVPFFRFRDPLLTDGAAVVFRASLGRSEEQSDGIFLADAGGTAPIVMDQQTLPDRTVLTGFSGIPAVSPDGRVVFVANRSAATEPGGPPTHALGSAILRTGTAGLETVVASGQRGPSGGTFKSLGQPATNSAGHVFFRGSFDAFSGGTPGLFLQRDAAIDPWVLRGEVAPVGGRFTTFGAQVALNAHDEVAFSASVEGGRSSNVLVVASPATLVPRLLAFRLSNGAGRDRLTLRAVLRPGRVSDGVHLTKEPITVALGDTTGNLWSATVPAKRLAVRGNAANLTVPPKSDLGKQLRAIALEVAKDGSVRVTARTPPFDLTRGGIRTLSPPFMITVEVGDDAGRANVSCTPGPRRTRCRS